MAIETQTCAIGILANRRNAPKIELCSTLSLSKGLPCVAFCEAGSSLSPLHLSRTLYKSTLFMQNKANFQKSQMNVNLYNTTDYENKSNWTLGENKPNSNPNKANLKRAKMNVNIYYTEVYENILCIRQSMKTNPNKPNSLKAQINANSLVIKDYENRWQRPVRKNKTNQSQFSNRKTEDRRQKTEDRRFFWGPKLPKKCLRRKWFF